MTTIYMLRNRYRLPGRPLLTMRVLTMRLPTMWFECDEIHWKEVAFPTAREADTMAQRFELNSESSTGQRSAGDPIVAKLRIASGVTCSRRRSVALLFVLVLLPSCNGAVNTNPPENS